MTSPLADVTVLPTPHAAPVAVADTSSLATALEFAKETHANMQDMVKVADAKATSIVALQALVLVILGSNLGQDVTAAIRGGGLKALMMGSIAVLMLLTTARSCWLCLQVLRPRSPKHVSPPTGARGLLWIDALNYQPSPDAYLAALRVTGGQERLADLAFENLKIAWILGEKFRFLTKAGPSVLWSFITWALLLIAAVGASPGSTVSS